MTRTLLVFLYYPIYSKYSGQASFQRQQPAQSATLAVFLQFKVKDNAKVSSAKYIVTVNTSLILIAQHTSDRWRMKWRRASSRAWHVTAAAAAAAAACDVVWRQSAGARWLVQLDSSQLHAASQTSSLCHHLDSYSHCIDLISSRG